MFKEQTESMKQAEPEGKQTSKVRLEWERSGEQSWVMTLDTLRLSVEPSEEGLDWSALVEAPWGADFVQYCDSLEDAKEYCEEKARELLRKDLKSLGGDVQAEPAEVKPAPESDIEPVITLSLEGPGSTLKLQVEGWELIATLMDEAAEWTHQCADSLREYGPTSRSFQEAKRMWQGALSKMMKVISAPSVNETNSSAVN